MMGVETRIHHFARRHLNPYATTTIRFEAMGNGVFKVMSENGKWKMTLKRRGFLFLTRYTVLDIIACGGFYSLGKGVPVTRNGRFHKFLEMVYSFYSASMAEQGVDKLFEQMDSVEKTEAIDEKQRAASKKGE